MNTTLLNVYAGNKATRADKCGNNYHFLLSPTIFYQCKKGQQIECSSDMTVNPFAGAPVKIINVTSFNVNAGNKVQLFYHHNCKKRGQHLIQQFRNKHQPQ